MPAVSVDVKRTFLGVAGGCGGSTTMIATDSQQISQQRHQQPLIPLLYSVAFRPELNLLRRLPPSTHTHACANYWCLMRLERGG